MGANTHPRNFSQYTTRVNNMQAVFDKCTPGKCIICSGWERFGQPKNTEKTAHLRRVVSSVKKVLHIIQYKCIIMKASKDTILFAAWLTCGAAGCKLSRCMLSNKLDNKKRCSLGICYAGLRKLQVEGSVGRLREYIIQVWRQL